MHVLCGCISKGVIQKVKEENVESTTGKFPNKIFF